MRNTLSRSTELTLSTYMIRVYKLLRLPIASTIDGIPSTIKSRVTSDVKKLDI